MCRMTKGEKVLPKKWSRKWGKASRGPGGPENFSCQYKGVRQRTWGKWVAEIQDPRDPKKKKKLWLGTFNTKEEAATAYDLKALEIFGPNTHLNLESSRAALQSNQNTVVTPLFSVPVQTLFSKTDSYSQPQAFQSNQNTVITPLFSVPVQTLFSKKDSYSQPQAFQSNQNTVITPLFSVPVQTLFSNTDSYSQPQVFEISQEPLKAEALCKDSNSNKTQDSFIPLEVKGVNKSEELPPLEVEVTPLDTDFKNLDKEPDVDFTSSLEEIKFK
ncbi:hypothetical protein AXG93_1129s1000 [Marchantia polymorpha subsp. ruderalis]|uniref:AP2/ERF domain-containing protein n=1 Tax=Marchantia polymorpha subsp. ruderalis TaxID=1480154 RepID=A0A176W2Q8_MARPO|nr:hypothetical protein AXG93_1129s1000 [Marchantia polymorpha subsp. ruderalis]